MEIKGKNYNLKYSLRSMFIWESMMDKPFRIETSFDTYAFFYACILADESNPHLDFNDLIDACDEDEKLIEEFNAFMEAELNRRSLLGDKKKETVTR